MTEKGSEAQPDILKELTGLCQQLNHDRLYTLAQGKWDSEEVVAALELRKTALEKTIEAVKAGHNRGTIVESMLSCFGLDPFYPPMF